MKIASLFSCAWMLPALLLPISLPTQVRAQGAIIETLDDLQDRPWAPAFHGALPSHADLTTNVPAPRSQDVTGSCTSWAVTYVAGSNAARRLGLGSSITLSPAFTYNKISRDPLCEVGTSASETLDLLKSVGALPIEQFAFDAGWCGRMPTEDELRRAAGYRIKGWYKLDATHIEDVKQQLARGIPVVFDIRTSQEFMAFKGDSTFNQPGVLNGTGHTMTAIGYDDARGAFRIQNSWGRKWGDGGYAWLSYDFWARNTHAGYVIY
jgi:hypothetical protein